MRSSSHLSPFSGVIKEEAEARCGGAEKLELAMARQDVTKVVDKGIEFFFFPSVLVGETQSTKNITRAERSKEISEDDFKAIAHVVDKMSWQFETTQAQLKDSLKEDKLPQEIELKLVKNEGAFKKVFNVADKLVSKLRVDARVSAQGRAATLELQKMLPKCSSTISGLHHMAKFHTDESGAIMSMASAKVACKKAKTLCSQLLDQCKVAKALAPKRLAVASEQSKTKKKKTEVESDASSS